MKLRCGKCNKIYVAGAGHKCAPVPKAGTHRISKPLAAAAPETAPISDPNVVYVKRDRQKLRDYNRTYGAIRRARDKARKAAEAKK